MKEYEKNLYQQNYFNIAGLDEAGRGCWAGPLVVAICIFDPIYINHEINDSKKIKEQKREKLFHQIIKDAKLVDWIVYDANFVDHHNPKQSSILGMQHLINKHQNVIDYCLIDFEKISSPVPTKSIIKGDAKSQSIAAASIVAKYIRDQIMYEIHLQYPKYSFNVHKGYGTKNIMMLLLNINLLKTFIVFHINQLKKY